MSFSKIPSTNNSDSDVPIHQTKCDEKFTDENDYRKHVTSRMLKNNDKSYVCDVFSKTFSKQNDLKFPSASHIVKQPFICDLCKRVLKSKGALAQHRLSHFKQKRIYNCETCGRIVSDSKALGRHLLTHTGERPFSCEICGKSFARKTTLNRHYSYHSDEKPFICIICNKGFKQKYDLRKHLMIHVDERPHVCHICSKGFIRKTDLNSHFLLHTGERPHICKICSLGFVRRKYMLRHYRRHLNKFLCDLCDGIFPEKTELIKHKLKQHLLVQLEEEEKESKT